MRRRKLRKPIAKVLHIVFVFFVLSVMYGLLTSFLHKDRSEVEIVEYVDPVYKHPYQAVGFQNQANGLAMYEDAVYTSSIGIDVSEHQGSIDCSTLKQQGVSFVMVRCGYRGYSEGILHRDGQFLANMDKVKQANLRRGVYFFSQAVSVEEAIEEANYVISLVSPYDLDLPIGYDMEYVTDHDRIANLTREEKTAIALAFVKQLREYGYKSYVYGSSWWLEDVIAMEDLQDDVKFWVAEYGGSVPGFVHDFEMWQYSEQGRLNGISTPVDMNLLIKRK